MAQQSEPADFGDAILKQGVIWATDVGIEAQLECLLPEASTSERAAAQGVLLALTELKFSPEQMAASVSKELFMERLRRSNPGLATEADIVNRTWNVLRDSISSAQERR